MSRLRLRLLPVLAFLLAVVSVACSTLGLSGDRIAFTASQLQGYLDHRFPRDYDKLGGLVTLTVMHPRLSIPTGSDRLRLDFDVGVGTMGRPAATPSGHLAIASGLRFDPQARGLFLDAPTLESAEMPALGGLGGGGRDLVNRWLADYARNEPVYRFDQSLWERLQARRIADTRIEGGQVVLHLDQ